MVEQKYEYRILEYVRPYQDSFSKEEIINTFAMQGWELICTSVIPMGVSDDRNKVEIKWICDVCGCVVVQKQGSAPPSKCRNYKCNSTQLTRSIGMRKQMWCIEHLYLRREKEKEENNAT